MNKKTLTSANGFGHRFLDMNVSVHDMTTVGHVWRLALIESISEERSYGLYAKKS